MMLSRVLIVAESGEVLSSLQLSEFLQEAQVEFPDEDPSVWSELAREALIEAVRHDCVMYL